MRYIGIDPGQDGGVACLNEDNSLELHVMPRIGKEVDLSELYKILEKYKGCFFGLENIRPFPGMSSSVMGKMMWIKGVKQGMIVSLKSPYELVEAKTWQSVVEKGIPLLKKSNGKNDTKGMALLASKRLFPNEDFLATSRSTKPHDGLIDATLIAYYLKLKHK